MSRMKKFLITAIALVVVGVVGCLFTYKEIAQPDVIHEEKYNNMSFSKVQLDADNAQINIHPTNDKEAKVLLTGKGDASRLDFSVGVTDSDGMTLKIALKEKHPNIFNFEFLTQKLTLDVYLPEKQYESMVLSNHNGKMHITNFDTTNLTATTNNGLIELKNITSKNVKVRTNNGKISMYYVEGDLRGHTDNGEILVETKDLDHPMDLSCDNGRISIKTDKEPTNATFAVHVDNGHINILNKYSNNTVIGKGKNLIKLSTDNGSITVTK